MPEGQPTWPSRQTSATNWFELLAGPDWYADAACREHPELRWVGSDNSAPQVKEAKAICAKCLAQTECLATAMDDPTLAGVWGGTTTRERQVRHRSGRRQSSQENRRSIIQPDAHTRAVVTHDLATFRSSNAHEMEIPPPGLTTAAMCTANESMQRNLSKPGRDALPRLALPEPADAQIHDPDPRG
jgi:WhiB family redox-sensing transcriptional regulator